MEIREKKKLANELRQVALKLVYDAQSGHIGGSYSAAEIYTEIFFEQMNWNPEKPDSLNNDIFVVDKGHASPGFYAAQHLAGIVSEEQLATYRNIDNSSPQGKFKSLQGHPKFTPSQGTWFSTGSLGVGICQAVGMAMAEKMAGRSTRVFVLVSEGGLEEGVLWEAARNAAYHKLDNLTAVLDLNWIQNDDFVFKTTELLPVADKWKSFGWNVIGEEIPYPDRNGSSQLNGHDFSWLTNSFEQAKSSNTPTILIANTTKGQGIPEIEDDPAWHAGAPNQEQYEKWMAHLQAENEAIGGAA
jgi:transketolase